MLKKLLAIILFLSGIQNIYSQDTIFFEGFETATTTTYTASDSAIAGLNNWEYIEIIDGRLRFSMGSSFCNSGSKAATLDAHTKSTYGTSINNLIKTIDLSNYRFSTDLLLNFSYQTHNEDDHAEDIVSVRANDSASWINIYDLITYGLTSATWFHIFIDLDSVIKANNIIPSQTFQIRFSQRDNDLTVSNSNYDGITFDDICLRGTPFTGLNAGVVSIIHPKVWISDSNTLKVSYQNRGEDTIQYLKISYKLENPNVLITDSLYLGAFLPGAINYHTFSTKIKPSTSPQSLKIWTTHLNGSYLDSNNLDDTLFFTIAFGLKDTLYVDSTGNGDFLTINAALDSLKTCGVADNTWIIIKNGYYNERLEMPRIKGSGPNSKVFFIGENKFQTIIIYSSTQMESRSTVKFDGAQYVKFKNLSVRNTSTSFGSCLFFTNQSNNIEIDSCNLIMPTPLYNESVVISASKIEKEYDEVGRNGNDIIISNCYISGGSKGICWIGEQNDSTINLHIFGNEFTNQKSYSIFVEYGRNTRIESNLIHNQTNDYAAGIYIKNTSLDTIINNIIRPQNMGIVVNYHNISTNSTSQYRSLFANNMVSDFGYSNYNTGISLSYYCHNINVYHNTIWCDGTNNNSYNNSTILAYSVIRYCDIQNNILIGENGALAIALKGFSSFNVNNNVYVYPTGNVNYYFYLSSYFKNYADYKISATTSVSDSNSYDNVDPLLTSKADLHLDISKNNQLHGTNVGITHDIDYAERNINNPCLGADEYPNYLFNVAIMSLDSPNVFIPGANTVKIKVLNRGTDSIHYASIGYQVNTSQAVQYDSIPLNLSAKWEEKDYVFPSPINFVKGKNLLKIWVSNPNGVAIDSNSLDDTLSLEFYSMFSDTFYISQTGNSDFISFNEAATELYKVGVYSHVTFIVDTGVYNEQVDFSDIYNAGENSTINFVGSNKDSVKLVFNSYNLATRATLILNGTNYLSLRNMTIQNNNSVDGTAVMFINNASHNTIDGCILKSSISTSYDNVSCINATSSRNKVAEPGNNGSHNHIINNRFYGGGNGITWANNDQDSNSRLIIENNEFFNQFRRSINIYKARGTIVKYNTFDSLRYQNGEAMYFYYTSLDTIEGNIVKPVEIGIKFYHHNKTLTSSSIPRTLIANNMISDFSDPYWQRGIYFDNYATHANFYHNTIWSKGTNSSLSNSALYISNPYYCNIKNNILKAENKSYAITLGTLSNTDCNYNVYIYPSYSTDNHFHLDTDFTTFTGYKNKVNLGVHDINSYDNVDPNIISYTDLHLDFTQQNTFKGDSIGVELDIDKQVRNIESPQIGADEFGFSGLNISLSSIDSPSVWIEGNSSLTVTYQNCGADTIQYIRLGYQINNDSIVTIDSINVNSLKSKDKGNYTFSKKMNIVKGLNELSVWATMPNGVYPDSVKGDDTLHFTKYTRLSDTFYIDSAGTGDFTSFTDAINLLNQAGVNGHVTFIVKPGTYYERFVIQEFPGVDKNSCVNFVGVHVDSVRIVHTGTSMNNRSTIVIDGADHIRLKDISIQNNGNTYSTGVFFTNGADNNIIEDCNISVPLNNNPKVYGINASSAETSSTGAGITGKYNSIKNCIISGGWSGILWNGYHYDSNHFLTVENNEIIKQYKYGLQLMNVRGTKILNNRIFDMQGNSSNGINCYNTSLDTIIGNIINPSTGGISFYHPNNSLDTNSIYKSIIMNNMIGDFSSSSYNVGISSLGDLSNFNIYHNTIWVDGTNTNLGSNTPINTSKAPFTSIMNNIFKATNHGYVFTIEYPDDLTLDYNDYIYSDSGNHFYKGKYYADFQSFKSDPYRLISDSHSYDNFEPYLIAKNDLHFDTTKVRALYGLSLGVQYDIDGDYRDMNMPSLGADENNISGTDIAIRSIDSPLVWIRGENNITITYQNTAKDTIRYLGFGYQCDTAKYTIDSVAISDLAFMEYGTYVFPVPLLLGKGSHNIDIWVTNPNGLYPDKFGQNDTTTINVYPLYAETLKDTLYIDSSGNTDFVSFNEALEALNRNGFSGHIVFIVKKGTYNERLVINALSGTNYNNTISFIGENKYDVIINHTGTSVSDRSTIVLNGVDYVTFDNITIKSSDDQYGTGILFTGRSEHTIIRNCIIDIYKRSDTYLLGINASATETAHAYPGKNGFYNLIENNKLIGGGLGILWYGSHADSNLYLVIRNNEFYQQNGHAIQVTLGRGSKIESNYFHEMLKINARAVCLYETSLDTVVSNIIHPAQVGIYLGKHNQNLSTNSSSKSLIANNIICDFTNTERNIGIHLFNYCYNVNVLHNTVKASGTFSSYSLNTALYADNYPKYSNIKNNIFIATSKAYAISLEYPYDLNLNHNDYIYDTTISVNRFYYHSYFKDFAGFKAKTSHIIHDTNSFDNVNPLFIDTISFKLDTTLFNNLFGGNVGLSYDIDNEARCIYNPILGADEVPFNRPLIRLIDSFDFGNVTQYTKYKTDIELLNRSCNDSVRILGHTNSDTLFKAIFPKQAVAPYEDISVSIEFETTLKGWYKDTLYIYTNVDTVTYYISANCIGMPKLSISVKSVYSNIICDDTVGHSITIKNLGEIDLELDIFSLTSGMVYNPALKTSLKQLDSVIYNFNIIPKKSPNGMYNYAIPIQSNDPTNIFDTIFILVELNKTPNIATSKDTIVFASPKQGVLSEETLTIYNTSCGDLKMLANQIPQNSYTLSFADTLIEANDSTLMTISFTPSISGYFEDTISVLSNDQPLKLILKGFVATAPLLTLESDTIDYTSVSCQKLNTLPFTIWNKGGQNLEFELDTTNLPQWLSFNNFKGTITPLDSQIIITQINTNNLSIGLHSFKLNILSNDSSNQFAFVQFNLYIEPAIFDQAILPNDTSICPNRDLTLVVSSTYQNYLWSTGDTTYSTTYTNLSSQLTTISVTVTDSLGCKVFDSIRVGNDTDCVYPGDANADGIVNTQDVLYIGLKYNQTGSNRPDNSITWRAEYSKNWSDTLLNGRNIKHIDTNGDSIINNIDTSAISLNYLKTRSLIENTRSSDPHIFIDLPDTLMPGQSITAPIILGTAENEVQDIYGLVFEISDDLALAKDHSFIFNFSTSWLGTESSDLLTFIKDNNLCLVRTDHNSKTGYGQIGEISFQLKDSIPNNSMYYLSIINAIGISYNQAEILLYNDQDSTVVINTSIEHSDEQDGYFVYPNPCKDHFHVSYNQAVKGPVLLEILNLEGKVIQTQLLNKVNNTPSVQVNIESLTNGLYIVRLISNDSQSYFKLIKTD